MAAKTIEERIKEAEEKVQQAKARLQKLEGLNRLKERKERTRRLIQVGGIMARLGVNTVEQAEALRKSVMDGSEKFKDWWTRTVGPIPGEDKNGQQEPGEEKKPS
jgi:hypothetical protein